MSESSKRTVKGSRPLGLPISSWVTSLGMLAVIVLLNYSGMSWRYSGLLGILAMVPIGVSAYILLEEDP